MLLNQLITGFDCNPMLLLPKFTLSDLHQFNQSRFQYYRQISLQRFSLGDQVAVYTNIYRFFVAHTSRMNSCAYPRVFINAYYAHSKCATSYTILITQSISRENRDPKSTTLIMFIFLIPDLTLISIFCYQYCWITTALSGFVMTVVLCYCPFFPSPLSSLRNSAVAAAIQQQWRQNRWIATACGLAMTYMVCRLCETQRVEAIQHTTYRRHCGHRRWKASLTRFCCWPESDRLIR